MITVSTTTYKQFGQCIKISNDQIQLLVTTDIGPRIIYAGIVGGENIMYEDTQDKINMGGEYFDKIGKGDWHIYGGQRLWKSPEDITSYYPENEKVDVEILDNGAIFTLPPMVDTLIQKSIKITMSADNSVEILSSFKNCGTKPTDKVALWSLIVLDKGAKTVIPQCTKDTGWLPNRNLVLWSYTDIKDSRLTIENDHIHLMWDNKPPIKIGTFVKEPIQVYTKGVHFVVAPDFDVTKEYADFGCNAEFYTSPLMMEVETLSSLESIEPNQTKYHREVWTLNKI